MLSKPEPRIGSSALQEEEEEEHEMLKRVHKVNDSKCDIMLSEYYVRRFHKDETFTFLSQNFKYAVCFIAEIRDNFILNWELV